MSPRIVTIALLVGASGVCHAAEPKPLDDYAKLRKKGDAALAIDDFPAAIAAYREAYAARPKDADMACNIGRTEFRLNHDREAAPWLERCLLFLPMSKSERELEYRKETALELLTVRTRLSTLTIGVEEPDAQVIVDNNAIGKTPLAEDIFVEPGEHRIKVLKGTRSVVTTISTKAGKEYNVALMLPPSLPPLEPYQFAPVLEITQKPLVEPFRWWPVVLGGTITVTGLAFGTAFTVLSGSASDTATDRLAEIQADGNTCAKTPAENDPRCASYDQYQKRSTGYSTASTASFIATGVIAASVIGYAIYESRRVSVNAGVGSIGAKYLW